MIVQNGIDVTDQVTKKAQDLGRVAMSSQHYKKHFDECFVHLIKAKQALESIERPWMDDFIYVSVQEIQVLIEAMKGVIKS